MHRRRSKTSTPPEPERLFRIYLQDHDAASAAGMALARRCAAENTDTDLGGYLTGQFLPELRVESETLRGVIEQLGSSRSPWKRAVARVGEFVGRAKANGRLGSYSALSRVVELEALISGVHAKHRMWVTLEHLRHDERPELPDIAGHRATAEEQMAHLERHHLHATHTAFTASSETGH